MHAHCTLHTHTKKRVGRNIAVLSKSTVHLSLLFPFARECKIKISSSVRLRERIFAY